jgi:hypothetical protein
MSDNSTPMSMWSVKQVAFYLGRDERTIWRMLSQRKSNEVGSIPHTRLPPSTGRRCTPRFDPETIKAWLTSGCPPADSMAMWANQNKAG